MRLDARRLTPLGKEHTINVRIAQRPAPDGSARSGRMDNLDTDHTPSLSPSTRPSPSQAPAQYPSARSTHQPNERHLACLAEVEQYAMLDHGNVRGDNPKDLVLKRAILRGMSCIPGAQLSDAFDLNPTIDKPTKLSHISNGFVPFPTLFAMRQVARRLPQPSSHQTPHNRCSPHRPSCHLHAMRRLITSLRLFGKLGKVKVHLTYASPQERASREGCRSR